jgi:2,3-diketo-5-methylthio-1-phosphopentane phosphatase
MAREARLVIVSDFDGTITHQDIGNELCRRFIPEKFKQLHRQYKEKQLSLRDYQNAVWGGFPLSAKEFTSASRDFAKFRDGCEAFLEFCSDNQVDVYVASCGIDAYIEPALACLSDKAQKCLRGIRCNKALFSHNTLHSLSMPSETGPFSLDKGAWCAELRAQSAEPLHILGVGNGTSDQSMVGYTDSLAATESLATYLSEKKIPYLAFETWNEIRPWVESRL